jgi:hypothetical protein
MNLKNLHDRSSPFVVYRKPGESEIFLIEPSNSTGGEEMTFVFAPFNSVDSKVLKIQDLFSWNETTISHWFCPG